MLLQLDGSHHAWLEQRGPRFALLLAVDDATGAVVHGLFGAVEDARGYFLLMEEVLRRSGVPLALYNDRHAVFRASAQQRAGGEASTQFARAMAELGVRLIFARSPQAKGRVERMAGTFQDRLVTELRLASATTIGEAQAVLECFLPRFNARFAVAARQPEPAWCPLDPALDLCAVLAFRHTRSVARDNTVKYHWRTLQLLPSAQRPSYASSPHPAQACCASAGSSASSERRWSASPRASAPVAVHPARRRTRLRPTARSSTPLRPPSCARRPRGRRRAGSRFNRPSCRDSRCAPPPGCSASHATPSGGSSAPPAHPGARVRHHLPSATSQTGIFAEP